MPRLVPTGAVWRALRKVGVNLLKLGAKLVRLLLLLSRNAQSRVTVNGILRDDFLVRQD